MTTKTQQLAALLQTHEYVIRAYAIGRTIMIEFPRERGGRNRMTLPEAKRLAVRLGLGEVSK